MLTLARGCHVLPACPRLRVCSVRTVGYALVLGLPEEALCPPSEGSATTRCHFVPLLLMFLLGMWLSGAGLVTLGSFWALPLHTPDKLLFQEVLDPLNSECLHTYVCVSAYLHVHVCLYTYAHASVPVNVALCVYTRVCQNMSSC